MGVNSDWMRSAMKQPHGCKCPCCGRAVVLYKRTVSASMVKALILIYRYYLDHDRSVPLHVEAYLKRCDVSSTVRGDFPKLRYWRLISKAEGNRPDGSSRNGKYFISSVGVAFVIGKIPVQKYALVYSNKLYGFEGDEIYIKDCLKKKFDYDKLMRGEM